MGRILAGVLLCFVAGVVLAIADVTFGVYLLVGAMLVGAAGRLLGVWSGVGTYLSGGGD